MSKKAYRETLVHCDNCGEDYAPSYKCCPFCGEADEKRRVTRGGGYTDPGKVRKVLGAVLSLCLILAAVGIVVSVLKPMLFRDSTELDQALEEEENQPSKPENEDDLVIDGTVVDPSVDDETIKDDLEDQGVVSNATGISLNLEDFTMSDPTLVVPITATVTPAEYTGTIVWTSTDESIAYVTQQGVVVPLSAGVVTITATIGDYSASCIARSKTTAQDDLIAQYVIADQASRDEEALGAATAGGQTSAQQPVVAPQTPSTPDTTAEPLSLNYEDITIHVGDTLTLLASGGDETYQWSSDADCVTVDANGKITAAAAGKANVTVSSNGSSVVCIVRVKA